MFVLRAKFRKALGLGRVFKLDAPHESVTRSRFARQKVCELCGAIFDRGPGCGSMSHAPKQKVGFENTSERRAQDSGYLA
jgi:hypothetical protein